MMCITLNIQVDTHNFVHFFCKRIFMQCQNSNFFITNTYIYNYILWFRNTNSLQNCSRSVDDCVNFFLVMLILLLNTVCSRRIDKSCRRHRCCLSVIRHILRTGNEVFGNRHDIRSRSRFLISDYIIINNQASTSVKFIHISI